MRRRRRRTTLALAVGVAVLGGCAGSDVVRPPDCLDCRPVTMDLDQVLEVELGADLSLGRPQDPQAYTWVLADSGTMELVSSERIRRSEDPEEFVGGYSYSSIWTLRPTAVGSTAAVFEHVRADTEEAVPGSRPTTIRVDVTG
jgi:hypothetical protein